MPHGSIDTNCKNRQARSSCEHRFLVIPKRYLDFILAELAAPEQSFVQSMVDALFTALQWTIERLRGIVNSSKRWCGLVIGGRETPPYK